MFYKFLYILLQSSRIHYVSHEVLLLPKRIWDATLMNDLPESSPATGTSPKLAAERREVEGRIMDNT